MKRGRLRTNRLRPIFITFTVLLGVYILLGSDSESKGRSSRLENQKQKLGPALPVRDNHIDDVQEQKNKVVEDYEAIPYLDPNFDDEAYVESIKNKKKSEKKPSENKIDIFKDNHGAARKENLSNVKKLIKTPDKLKISDEKPPIEKTPGQADQLQKFLLPPPVTEEDLNKNDTLISTSKVNPVNEDQIAEENSPEQNQVVSVKIENVSQLVLPNEVKKIVPTELENTKKDISSTAKDIKEIEIKKFQAPQLDPQVQELLFKDKDKPFGNMNDFKDHLKNVLGDSNDDVEERVRKLNGDQTWEINLYDN